MSKWDDLVEEYFDRLTSVERKQQIEAELREKAPSKALLKLDLGDAVKNEAEIVQLRSTLAELEAPVASKRRYWVAASFTLLVLSALLVIFRYTGTTSSEQLFARYYTPYPVDVYRGNDGGELPETLAEYKKKNYKKAVERIGSSLKGASDKDLLLIYLGNSQLNIGQVVQAMESFSKVSAVGSSYADAQWYLALSYLKAGRMEESRTILEQLILTKNQYQVTAKDLLSELPQ